MENIAVYGYGYVGKAIVEFLRGHYDLAVIEPKFPDTSCPGLEQTLEQTGPVRIYHKGPEPLADFYKSFPYAVICVPTPALSDGSCDTSIVQEVIRSTNHRHYLVKSTVPPGTCERIQDNIPQSKPGTVTFSPEYIGEGKYAVPFWRGFPHPTDMKLHNFHIFGEAFPGCSKIWLEMWQRVAGWVPKYLVTDSTTAEMVKYAENMFLATKKIFCDELYSACSSFGIDYNRLRELWLLDERVGPAMTLVYPDKRGFDGKCLPKDTAAIISALDQVGYSANLWKEVIASNKRIRGEA